MADNRLYVAVKPARLSAAIGTTDTSMTVSAVTDRYGNTLTAADFGAIGYCVIAPNKDNEEQITFTGITGTTISGITRGVEMKAPYGNSASLASAHSAGEVVILYTNSPAFYDSFANKENDETVTGTWLVPTPTVASQVVNKSYADALAIAGSPNASTTDKGIVELPTQAEVDARTTTGSTGALLAITPDTLRATKYHDYAVDGGATDAYAITVTPAITAYSTGQQFTFKANTANTGACTLDVNGLGAIAIKEGDENDTQTGDIVANQLVTVVYDGANMKRTAFSKNISNANATTLTTGVTSDASALHFHKVGSPVAVSSIFTGAASLDAPSNSQSTGGWSDTNGVFAFLAGDSNFSQAQICKDASLFGFQPFAQMLSVGTNLGNLSGTAANDGFVYIDTDAWLSNGTNIRKNNTGVTISGTSRFGKLAHNPTTSSLLVLYSTTKIAQFSGISGTTITNLNTDITLDTAVSQNYGFIYDSTNSRYIAIDGSNNIRRFTSSGSTIDSISISGLLSGFTQNGSFVAGLAVFQGRVMVAVCASKGQTAAADYCVLTTTFYPTSMTL